MANHQREGGLCIQFRFLFTKFSPFNTILKYFHLYCILLLLSDCLWHHSCLSYNLITGA